MGFMRTIRSVSSRRSVPSTDAVDVRPPVPPAVSDIDTGTGTGSNGESNAQGSDGHGDTGLLLRQLIVRSRTTRQRVQRSSVRTRARIRRIGWATWSPRRSTGAEPIVTDSGAPPSSTSSSSSSSSTRSSQVVQSRGLSQVHHLPVAFTRKEKEEMELLATEMSELLKRLLHLRLNVISQNTTPVFCVICSDELSSHETVTRLPCGHLFHASCILQWFLRSGKRNHKEALEQLERQQSQAQAQAPQMTSAAEQRRRPHTLRHEDSAHNRDGISTVRSVLAFRRKSRNESNYCWSCPCCRHVITCKCVGINHATDPVNARIQSRFLHHKTNPIRSTPAKSSNAEIHAPVDTSSTSSGDSRQRLELPNDDEGRVGSNVPASDSVFAWCGSDPVRLRLPRTSRESLDQVSGRFALTEQSQVTAV